VELDRSLDLIHRGALLADYRPMNSTYTTSSTNTITSSRQSDGDGRKSA
jgi:hypothetical protein